VGNFIGVNRFNLNKVNGGFPLSEKNHGKKESFNSKKGLKKKKDEKLKTIDSFDAQYKDTDKLWRRSCLLSDRLFAFDLYCAIDNFYFK
jgi:hypothetical protein